MYSSHFNDWMSPRPPSICRNHRCSAGLHIYTQVFPRSMDEPHQTKICQSIKKKERKMLMTQAVYGYRLCVKCSIVRSSSKKTIQQTCFMKKVQSYMLVFSLHVTKWHCSEVILYKHVSARWEYLHTWICMWHYLEAILQTWRLCDIIDSMQCHFLGHFLTCNTCLIDTLNQH